MVTNGEYIKKWLSDMKIKKFSVWKSDKGTINRNNGYAFASKDDESSETNIENFFDWCQYNNGCYVLTQAEGNANNAELEFCLPFKSRKAADQEQNLTAGQLAVQGTPAGAISIQEMETRLENERMKMRLERMEEELKEAKESSSAKSEFFKTLTPFVGPVLQGLLSRHAAVAAAPAAAQIGTADDNTGFDIPDEQFKQLTEDLQRWSAADPDYLTLIHKISLLTDDQMYMSAKQLIINR